MPVPNASTLRSGPLDHRCVMTSPYPRSDWCDAGLTDPPAHRGDILGVFEHYRLAAQANPALRLEKNALSAPDVEAEVMVAAGGHEHRGGAIHPTD